MQSGTAPISPRPPVGAVSIEGGLDSVTGSLEDLVSTFDEKLTMCFADYQEQVDKIAPVQVCILFVATCPICGCVGGHFERPKMLGIRNILIENSSRTEF